MIHIDNIQNDFPFIDQNIFHIENVYLLTLVSF